MVKGNLEINFEIIIGIHAEKPAVAFSEKGMDGMDNMDGVDEVEDMDDVDVIMEGEREGLIFIVTNRMRVSSIWKQD